MKLEIENEEIANTGATIRTFRGASLLQPIPYKTIKGLPLHVYIQQHPCPAPSYPSGCADADQRGSFLPAPVTTPTLTTKILPGLWKWAINPKLSTANGLSKLRYGRKILGAGAPSEGMKAIHWIEARYGHRLFHQAVPSHLDFGEAPTGQRRDTDGGRVVTFDVVGNGTRKQQPFVCDFARKELTAAEWSAEEAERRRRDYDMSLKVKAASFDTEAELRKVVGGDYQPPEISPSRNITTSRETTKSSYTDETETVKSVTEHEKWRDAILETFAKRSVDFDFTDGLYMLVKRPRQAPRVYLVLDAKDFLAPDDRVYIDTEQFQQARSLMAKRIGVLAQLLPGPGSCQILGFEQHGPEIKVTQSDWVLCPTDFEILEGVFSRKFNWVRSLGRKNQTVEKSPV